VLCRAIGIARCFGAFAANQHGRESHQANELKVLHIA
jgi:hypothetical protein